MKFASTRGQAPAASFSDALLTGLAPDGGLYVPQQWPSLAGLQGESLPRLGAALIGAVAGDDPLATQLPAICADAFDFPAPLKALGSSGRLNVLELFHGPTAAFKDFGARFLAASLARIPASVLVVVDKEKAPDVELLKAARAAGVKVAFSSGGGVGVDEARLKARLQAINAAGLGWKDFWVPGKP